MKLTRPADGSGRRPLLGSTALALAALLGTAGVASASDARSSATRLPDGRVRLVVAATAPDGCTVIGSVAVGAPLGVSAEEGAIPVTARLRRRGAQACTMALTTVRAEAVFEAAGEDRVAIHVLAADGRLLASDTVPIR